MVCHYHYLFTETKITLLVLQNFLFSPCLLEMGAGEAVGRFIVVLNMPFYNDGCSFVKIFSTFNDNDILIPLVLLNKRNTLLEK